MSSPLGALHQVPLVPYSQYPRCLMVSTIGALYPVLLKTYIYVTGPHLVGWHRYTR